MKKITLLLAISIFVFQTAYTKNNSRNISETRNVTEFSKIHIKINADVNLVHGTTAIIKINASKKELKNIKSSVKNGVLIVSNKIVSNKKNKFFTIKKKKRKITVTITYTNLEEINISGSATVTAQDTITTSSLYFKTQGSANIVADIDTDTVENIILGSGRVTLSGTTTDLVLSISGSADIEAEDLVSKKATVNISGSGNARVQVLDAIDANISGSGSVYYTGNPSLVDTNISGSGKVTKE